MLEAVANPDIPPMASGMRMQMKNTDRSFIVFIYRKISDGLGFNSVLTFCNLIDHSFKDKPMKREHGVPI